MAGTIKCFDCNEDVCETFAGAVGHMDRHHELFTEIEEGCHFCKVCGEYLFYTEEVLDRHERIIVAENRENSLLVHIIRSHPDLYEHAPDWKKLKNHVDMLWASGKINGVKPHGAPAWSATTMGSTAYRNPYTVQQKPLVYWSPTSTTKSVSTSSDSSTYDESMTTSDSSWWKFWK